MMAMAAIAGTQWAGSWAQQRGDAVDAERILSGKSIFQTLRVAWSVQDQALRQRCSLLRVTGLSGSCGRPGRKCFRVTAQSEVDDVAMETALRAEDSLQAEQPASGASDSEGTMVKVRFELQRECQFGQQYKVVGDDSQFGDWNPSAAIPLNWTEGHVWTAEVSVPEGKNIEYKYILISGEEGEVEWQPGSNHVLETVTGAPSLVLSPPWEGITQFAEPTESTSDQLQEVQSSNQPEVQSAAPDTGDWESTREEANASVEKVADAVAFAAAGAVEAGVKAASVLEGNLDSVAEDRTRTAVEVPVVNVALASVVDAALVTTTATPAEEPTTTNGAAATADTATEKEHIKAEEQIRKDEEQLSRVDQPSIDNLQLRAEEEQNAPKRLNPFQKDMEWLSKTLFGR
uniref:CBM20 domain-containing protein n=2 Tax=Physcomitrium patens TaxID=3218 RepID=A0A7I4F6X4_PHYPA